MTNAQILSLLMVAVYTLAIYLMLVLAINVFGRRQRGQLNCVDLLVMLLLGSAVETAMVNGSSSFKVGIVSATTLFIANRGLSLLTAKWPWFSALMDNPPLIVAKDGKPVEGNLRLASLTEEDLLEAVRLRGMENLKTVRYAVLEADGQISVVPYAKAKPEVA